MATSPTSPNFEGFSLFHAYNRLVRRGVTKPLMHSCGTEYVLTIGDADEPVLRCFSCNTRTYPGLNMVGNIRAVVKEHFG